MNPVSSVMIITLLVLAVILVLVFLRYVPLGLWVRALSSGVKLKVSTLIGMRLRRISPHRLVDTFIMVRKAGLDLSIDQAVELFSTITPLKRKLQTLQDVGLGYLKLGQSATTLSGGEAQRVKLAAELSRVPRGHTVYILDEPTTGLHLADIDQLLKVLFKLRDLGNSVIVIEHNLDVIKTADHIIDIGPEGGDGGGRIIASGTPEEICRSKTSHTARFLKPLLKK